MNAVAPLLTFRDLTLGYERHPAVHHLSAVVEDGALVAVCGPNGAGKSTLLKGICGALKPLGGRIERHGLAAQDVAYLPQAAEVDLDFPICVFDLVAMGLWKRSGLFGGIGGKDRDRVTAALAAVGLAGFERRIVGTLSGGQLQRVLFARLMLQDARLILLDEPFSALDATTLSDLLGVVRTWHEEGRTVLAVLHDLDLVRAVFPDTLLLARRPIAFGPTAEVLRPDILTRAYGSGHSWQEAWSEAAPDCTHAA